MACGSQVASLVVIPDAPVAAVSPYGVQVVLLPTLAAICTRIVATAWKVSPAAKDTPLAPTLIDTWFASTDVQLRTPGSLLTQPFAPKGTKTTVPGSGVVHVVSVQASVKVTLPVSIAITGVGGAGGVVLLLLVMVMRMSFVCPTCSPVAQVVPVLGKIGIEALA